MRGLKLWIRPTTPDDRAALAEFYRRESTREPDQGAVSLVGKLLGRIVAHATARRDEDSFWISTVYVARELRRRGIASAVISELQKIATDSGANSLIAGAGAEGKFFESLGFIERNGVLRKVIVQARE